MTDQQTLIDQKTLNNVIDIILKTANIIAPQKVLDLTLYKKRIDALFIQIQSKLDPDVFNQINNYFNNNILITQIINTSINNIQSIMEDGKITIGDTSHFLDLLIKIFESVNIIHQNYLSVKLLPNDLVELVSLLIQMVFIFFIDDDKTLKTVTNIINSSGYLVKFTMNHKPDYCQFFCF